MPIIVARTGTAADECQNLVRSCSHQLRRLQTGVTRLDNLRGSPDQNIRVPDGRHAVFRHGLDTNGDCSRAKVDRYDTLGFGKGKEWISHKILRVARREIAGKRAEQIELFAL